MKRPVLWIAAAFVMLAVGVTYWYLQNYERVTVRRREAPKAEARRDPYLALDRFFTRMGRPLTRTSDADVLRSLPEHGALVLDRRRQYHLNPGREAALHAWVERGGYLLLVPEGYGVPDRLLESLELTRPGFAAGWNDQDDTPSADGEDADEADRADGTEQKTPAAGARPTPAPPVQASPLQPSLPWPGSPPTLAVSIPGSPRALTIRVLGRFRAGDVVPDWSAGDKTAALQVAHFTRGRGAVTVVEGLDSLASNYLVGEHDHAELVWTLLQRYRPDGPIVLLSRLQTPTLFAWLATNARAALASAGACLALWLWHIGPRFGRVMPAVPPDRRQLDEHLRAIGRFVWRQGGPQTWVTVMRSAFAERQARRFPAALSADDRVRVLAAQSGLPAADVARALHASATRVDEFVAVSRTLQHLERSL